MHEIIGGNIKKLKKVYELLTNLHNVGNLPG